MKILLPRLVGGAVVLMLLALVLCPPAKADAQGDIKALEDRFIAALKAKDLDAIMKVYVPDQTLFVFDVVPPRQYVGAAAYRKGLAGVSRQHQRPDHCRVNRPRYHR
jgi:ketosteroid isomerase-like protein